MAQAAARRILFSKMKKRPPYIAEHVSLAPLTTLHLGGSARYFATCTSTNVLKESLQWASRAGIEVQVLGGGSNVVFADQGFDGLVLQIGLRGMQFRGDTARIAAGECWDDVVAKSISRGLAGIECLSGIPGLVGATPIQNVGAYGQEVSETIASVRAIDRHTLEEVEFGNDACDFAYRHSRFKGIDSDRYVITEVCYALRGDGQPQLRYGELRDRVGAKVQSSAGPDALNAVRTAVLALRKSKSMIVDSADPNSRSAGSFFVNPVISPAQFEQLRAQHATIPSFADANGVKVPAAWLVEHAGFAKGYRHGGVGISQRHALALINCDGSTHELLELAEHIRDAVEAQFGVRLQREPVVVE